MWDEGQLTKGRKGGRERRQGRVSEGGRERKRVKDEVVKLDRLTYNLSGSY